MSARAPANTPSVETQKLAPRTLASLLRRVEAMSVRKVEQHWAYVPADLAKRLRAAVTRVGDGFLTRLATSDSLRMNRVSGFGHLGGAEARHVDEIVAWYRAARVARFSLELGPGPQMEAIIAWLLERGFEESGGAVLLLRDCRKPVPRAPAGVRVARARPHQLPMAVNILETCFGSPASRRSWSLAAAHDEGLEQYLAYVGETPAAVGVLRVEDGLGWMGGGATLTRWRGRGAHSALILARLRRAARAGCRWTWVETAAPAPGRPDISRRNLLRFGFEQICHKPRFVWRAL